MDKHSYVVDYAYDLTNAELIIYVSKNKYQFFPDASAVIEECKSAVQPIRYSVVKKENIRTEKKTKKWYSSILRAQWSYWNDKLFRKGNFHKIVWTGDRKNTIT